MHLVSCLVFLLAIFCLQSCSGSLNTRADHMARVKVQASSPKDVSDRSAQGEIISSDGEKYDPVREEEITKLSLKAWRISYAEDEQGKRKAAEWLKAKAKAEADAMQILEDLARKYPSSSYIKTMMGQVMQHHGKKLEAAKYYEEAMAKNRRDPILLLKVAEARRTAGDTKKAVEYYRETLKMQPNFSSAKLGLARALLAEDPKSSEGRQIIDDALVNYPQDPELIKIKSELGPTLKAK